MRTPETDRPRASIDLETPRPVHERMNSPLEKHDVRLRGLHHIHFLASAPKRGKAPHPAELPCIHAGERRGGSARQPSIRPGLTWLRASSTVLRNAAIHPSGKREGSVAHSARLSTARPIPAASSATAPITMLPIPGSRCAHSAPMRASNRGGERREVALRDVLAAQRAEKHRGVQQGLAAVHAGGEAQELAVQELQVPLQQPARHAAGGQQPAQPEHLPAHVVGLALAQRHQPRAVARAEHPRPLAEALAVVRVLAQRRLRRPPRRLDLLRIRGDGVQSRVRIDGVAYVVVMKVGRRMGCGRFPWSVDRPRPVHARGTPRDPWDKKAGPGTEIRGRRRGCAVGAHSGPAAYRPAGVDVRIRCDGARPREGARGRSAVARRLRGSAGRSASAVAALVRRAEGPSRRHGIKLPIRSARGREMDETGWGRSCGRAVGDLPSAAGTSIQVRRLPGCGARIRGWYPSRGGHPEAACAACPARWRRTRPSPPPGRRGRARRPRRGAGPAPRPGTRP